MSDPQCGLHVPILAMTLHPQTGNVLPVGGIHTDPVTGLPVPIELGSLMADPVSGRAVPILAVTLNEETGEWGGLVYVLCGFCTNDGSDSVRGGGGSGVMQSFA